MSDEEFSPLRWAGDALELLDQTRLPHEEVWLSCRDAEDVARAIRRLAVRGAPAIGVAAAYGLALAAAQSAADGSKQSVQPVGRFEEAAELLLATRPTAVNLQWALERGQGVFAARGTRDGAAELLAWARALQAADVATNRRMGEHGSRLFHAGDRALTHCNTGALATAGYGTALGVLRTAHAAGALAMVWVDETRPLLQGARLTAWELGRLGIPYRLITDSSAGALLQRGQVDRVIVGADRIAANGDTANKIGTYPLAVVAARHGVPFYVAAPLSTIDPATASGASIEIEERDPKEVTELFGTAIAPAGAAALNLAFDVTPHDLIAGLVTEAGVLRPPYTASIAGALATNATAETEKRERGA